MQGYMEEFCKIIMMIGLGYSIAEVADKTGLTYNQVRYRQQLIRELVQEHGDARVFYQIIRIFLGMEGIKRELSGWDFDQLATV